MSSNKFVGIIEAEYDPELDWEDCAILFEEAISLAQRELDQQAEVVENNCRRVDEENLETPLYGTYEDIATQGEDTDE